MNQSKQFLSKMDFIQPMTIISSLSRVDRDGFDGSTILARKHVWSKTYLR